MADGMVMGVNLGFSSTPNPYSASGYYSVGKSNALDRTDASFSQGDGTKKVNPDGKHGGSGKFQDGFKTEECQTCKNRKYQDVSDDSSVSFQTPTKISKGAELSRVLGHEHEHVAHNRAEADREGREVVSQSVTIKTGICPECGKSYIAGGETRTTTRNKTAQKFDVGMGGDNAVKGKSFSAVA